MSKRTTFWAVRGPRGLISSIHPSTNKEWLRDSSASYVAELIGCWGEMWVRGIGGPKRAWRILNKKGFKIVKVKFVQV
jgi:hypothetical protein